MNDQIYNKNEIEINMKIKKPKIIWVYLLCIFIIAILGITDYISGIEMSFSIFYLIPITLAVLLSNFINALIISFLSIVVWYSADLYAGHYYSNHLITFQDFL